MPVLLQLMKFNAAEKELTDANVALNEYIKNFRNA